MEKKSNNENNNKILGDHLLNQVFFDKYKLVKKLGEGSFGMIFKAESPNGKFAFKFENKIYKYHWCYTSVILLQKYLLKIIFT